MNGWFLVYGLNYRAVTLADLSRLLSTGEASPSTRLRYGENGAPTTLGVALPGLLLQDGLSRLGLPKDAGLREAKLKYRELSLALHPDKNQGQGSQDEMARINVGLGYVRDFLEAAHAAGQLPVQDDGAAREEADFHLDMAVSSRKPRDIRYALDTYGRAASPKKLKFARALLAQLDWDARQEEERKSAEVLKQVEAEMEEARRKGQGEVANAPSAFKIRSEPSNGTEQISELQKAASGLQLGVPRSQNACPPELRTTQTSSASSKASDLSPSGRSASGTPTYFTNGNTAAAGSPTDAADTGFADWSQAIFPPPITPIAPQSTPVAAAMPQTASAKAVPAPAAFAPAQAVVVGTPAVDASWEWDSDTSGRTTVWAAYVAPLNSLLEAAYAANSKSASFVIGSVPYTVEFDRGVQRRLQPPCTERQVRRSLHRQGVVSAPSYDSGASVHNNGFASVHNNGLANVHNNVATSMRRLFRSPEVSLDSQMFSEAAGRYHSMCDPTMRTRVTQVDVYESVHNKYRFDEQRAIFQASGAPLNEVWVFHGTSSKTNVAEIMQNGFKVGGVDLPIKNGARFGHGVYTATGPDTPWRYAQESQCVILARGLKGRSGATDSPYFNSWCPQDDWMVFAASAQLLPVYVIHLAQCPTKEAPGMPGVLRPQRSRSFTRVFRKK